MTEERAERKATDFVAMELEKPGTLWGLVKAGVSVGERRQIAYAYKSLIEDQVGKKPYEDWETADLTDVSNFYLWGLLMAITTKSQTAHLLAGEPILDTMTLTKKAGHAGRIYKAALLEYRKRTAGAGNRQPDLQAKYDSHYRQEMLTRALSVVKSMDLDTTTATPYRQVVISLLPQSKFELYMRYPKNLPKLDECNVALKRAHHCGAGYVQAVREYMDWLKSAHEDNVGLPEWNVILPDTRITGYSTYEEELYAMTSHYAQEKARTIAGEVSKDEEVNGVIVKITQDMQIKLPQFLGQLEQIQARLDGAGLDNVIKSTLTETRICVRDDEGETLGCIRLLTTGGIFASEHWLDGAITGGPIKRPKPKQIQAQPQPQVSVDDDIEEDMESLAEAYARAVTGGEMSIVDIPGGVRVFVTDGYDPVGYVDVTLHGGYSFHITDKKIKQSLKRELYMLGY